MEVDIKGEKVTFSITKGRGTCAHTVRMKRFF